MFKIFQPFFGKRPEPFKETKRPYPTHTHTSFEEWISDPINSQHLSLSKSKQYDMYLYWYLVENAANNNSTEILPQA